VRLERKAKRRMDAYFDELVRACEIQEGLSNNEDAPL
jgi:hypothetical protein